MGDPRPINPTLGRLTFGRATAPAGTVMRAPPPSLQAAFAPTSLKILHILRAPLGGLFRHVVDVAQGQIERGHRVGLIVDSTTGGARADAILAELAPRLALGIERVPITRELSRRDIHALWRISRRVKAVAPDVLHGHGAKGAALARLDAERAGRDPRLYAAWRFAGLLPRHVERRLLSVRWSGCSIRAPICFCSKAAISPTCIAP